MHRFTRAILRQPGPDFAAGLTTAAWREPPEYARLLAQHRAYADALREAGLALELLPALPGLPDAYFVEDVAIVLPELAIVTRPGAEARRGEVEHIVAALARHRTLARIEAPATLDGGDAMLIGRELFIGSSQRSNAAGIAALRGLVEPHGYRVIELPVAAGLHLKSSVNAIAPGLLIATPAFARLPQLRAFEIIELAPEEAHAANALRVNDHLLIAAAAPRLARALRERGLEPRVLDMSEVAKMDGGLSCLSLRL